jgi:NAD(P)-dependent dehydrogenase (short-subunit alcohol dehydrogenase family)
LEVPHRRKAHGACEPIFYTASKTAIEGFTGSLAHELQAFNVRVKLGEPGYAPTTRFSQNTELRTRS